MNKYLFTLEHIKTENKPGELVNINFNYINKKLNINFKYDDIFYITDLNSIKSRGNHSNNNINEIIICLEGKYKLSLFDGKKEYSFDIKKNQGIYVPKNIWLEFNNFKNCVLLVFVEKIDLDKKISIYDKKEFITYINNE